MLLAGMGSKAATILATSNWQEQGPVVLVGSDWSKSSRLMQDGDF